MNEHNEPNFPDLNELCDHVQAEYGKDMADRVGACLLACIGMSNEQIKSIPQLKEAYEIIGDLGKQYFDKTQALKAALAEAVKHLEYLHTTGGICSEFDAKKVRDYLDNRQKGG